MMMALDRFVFGLSTLAYQSLQRQTEWRQAATPRIGARPARQFLGPGEETLTLTGVLAPELTGTLASLKTLRDMGDSGDAYALVDGQGTVYGAFVIDMLTENQTYLTSQGRPQRIEFTLGLKRVAARRG